MRVLRTGGHYLASRERRLWIVLIVAWSVLVGGLVAVVWTFLTRGSLSWAGGVAGPLGIVVATSAGRRLSRVRKGRLGERLIASLLGTLSDDFWLINDVTLGARRGNVDHVLVGPCGVVVIETKRLRGRIRCRGDAWSVNGFHRRSISKQVNAGACAVRYLLTERQPDTPPRWVEAVVVFTHPLCRLEIVRPRWVVVVRYSELLQLVRSLAAKHQMRPEVARRLAETLAAAQGQH